MNATQKMARNVVAGDRIGALTVTAVVLKPGLFGENTVYITARLDGERRTKTTAHSPYTVYTVS